MRGDAWGGGNGSSSRVIRGGWGGGRAGGCLTRERGARRYASNARERSDESALGTFVYQWEAARAGESVFTRENLLAMRETESLVLGSSYDAFCRLQYDAMGAPVGCVAHLSPLLYFFPSYDASGKPVYDGGGDLVDDPDAVVRDLFARNVSAFGYFLGDFDPSTNVVGITRAKYPIGSPLKATSTGVNEEEALRSFLDPIETALFRRYDMRGNFVSSPYMRPTREKPPASMITRWDNEILRRRDSARVISSDLAWAIGSIAGVWLFMVFNTGSVFIATVGMFEILASFPIAILIYRYVFRIGYLGSIQALSIFICLGIGADDVFVYWDAFRQSAQRACSSGDSELHERLMSSSTRASKAIFVTSLTTTGAFLATAWSSITPLAGFGILSATMIAVLFAMNIVMFPAALVIYARYFERMRTFRCPCIDRIKLMNDADGDVGKAGKLCRIERFFNGPFYDAINSRAVRFALISGFIVTFVFSSRFCLRLETPSKLEKWYDSRHLSQRFVDREQASFMPSDDDVVVKVDIFWGLNGVDMSGVNRWDLNSRGRLVLDSAFDVSPAASQAHVFEACLLLRSTSCFSPGCNDGRLTRKVDCFMEAFREYVGPSNFPVPQNKFFERLWEFRASPAGASYAQQIGFRSDDHGNAELFFVKVTATSTLQLQAPASVSRHVHDAFESFIDDLNAAAPPGVRSASQTAYLAWTWMRMQETLVENTFSGISICFCMSFIVLCLSTGNVLVASICSLAVAGVVVSVLGLGVERVMHWDLGIRETIAAVILIGLSVDYGVHLGNAYVEAPKSLRTREQRVRYALTTMGVSIVGSAATTIISGSILWLCTLQFFAKFAFLITTTIASSIIWSLGFISLMLLTLGPQGDDWKLRVMLDWARVRVRTSLSFISRA